MTIIGFELNDRDAAGVDEGEGWFFVFKERVGEVRFGLDLADGAPLTALNKWDDMAWEHLDSNVANINYLDPSITKTVPQNLNSEPNPDFEINWGRAGDAAQMAYILFQLPVLVAIHASDALPPFPASPSPHQTTTLG